MNSPRPDVEAFLALINAVPGPRMHDMTTEDARASMLTLGSFAELPTGDLAVIRPLMIPGPVQPIPARLYDARPEREPGPVMVFFHGGGFVIGDLDTHEPYCAAAARALDMPVISIDYRLAPEHRWPAAPDDCEAAARWIAGNPPELGVTAKALVLSGDSAGGNLAIVTAMALRDVPAALPVAAQFVIYPVVDNSGDYPSYREHGTAKLLTIEAMAYFDKAYGAEPGHVRAFPLTHGQSGMPPTLVLGAGLDPLRDQARAYAAALANAGVEVSYREVAGNIHGFINLRKAIPSSVHDVNGALAVLKAMIEEG